MKLQVYHIVPHTRVLGPFLRFALWVQGCPLRCPGCMTPGSLPFEGGMEVAVDALAAHILATPGIEGLTLSGGEPFAQAGALAALLALVRAERDLGVIIYSGYILAKLRRMQSATALLAQTDLLIDGQYQAKRNDGLSLRGSANQKIHALSQRYRDAIPLYYGQSRREVEAHLGHDSVMLVGIPGVETLRQWQILKENG